MSNWEDIPIREFPERGILWMLEQPNNLQGLVEIVTKEIAEQLDFTQAEQLERTFMSEDLHKLIADVLYKIPFRHAKGWVYVFILVEHQSKTDKTMALRLLAYMLEIWNAQSREWKEKKLPAKEWRLYPIIPIVFYTGKQTWKTLPTLKRLMDLPKLLERFVPEFDSLLLPLKEVPNSELMGSAVALAMQALKAATDPHEVLAEVLLQVASRLKEMSVEQQAECRRGLIYLYQLVRHKRPSEEQESLFELLDEVLESELSGESEEAKMTGAQVLLAQGRKEGRREGREEGREEGRQEGQQELLLELLTSKFGNLPEPMMSRINRLTNEQIKELAKQVLKASSLQELNM